MLPFAQVPPPPTRGSGHLFTSWLLSLGATNTPGLIGLCHFLMGCTLRSYQEESILTRKLSLRIAFEGLVVVLGTEKRWLLLNQ